MKRLLIFLLIIIFAAAYSPSYAAVAEESVSATYARATGKEAYFFSDKSLSSSLFAVPYTYCIEVVRSDGDWYYAKYGEDYGAYRAVYGYCRQSDFKVLSSVPETTYLYKTISVTYSAGEGQTSLPALGDMTVEAAFYGTYYSGATAYSYVLCNGSFGYIEGANDDYPLISDESEETEDGDDETSDESDEDENATANAGLIAALIICALAAAALVMLIITARKPRPDA